VNSVGFNKWLWAFAWLVLATPDAQAQLASRLYGVSGDGSLPEETSETLFILDKTDASSTVVMKLGNGDDGEEIAFNPDDGLLYHASGRDSNRVFETIHPGTLAITNIPLSGDAYTSVAGMTYEGSGVFLVSQPLASDGISTLTTAGVAASIASTDAAFTGLAYVGSTLYAVAKEDDLLRTIDPLSGDTLDSVAITLSGYTVYGANGLATDPLDDSLWALLKIVDRFPGFPEIRALAVIDTVTGVATLIGQTDVVGMAGIAFVSGEAVTVTSSVGTGPGSISPLGAQVVISGLATSFTLTPDPGYVIESVGGTCGGTLVDDTFTTDPVTADCTVVANFEPEPTTRLYGVTGNGGIPAETLFRLDMSDASTTLVMTLGNGDDGEEIAFNRDNGLLYHISGTTTGSTSDPIFETINLSTTAVTPVPLSGDNYKEVTGFTYAGPSGFTASDRTTASGLSNITTAGAVTNIGPTETTLTGLAYIGTTLYAVARDDDLLRTIDPATGATLGSVQITLPGYTVWGATGLTTNPDDNSLWAILKSNDPVSQPYGRVLATIDRTTGAATYIGTPDVVGLAGLAFEFIPCDPCEVTPSVGGGPGTISPSTVQDVAYSGTTAFTLTPAAHYHVDYVGGTCGGTLAGDVFTTAPIYTHCEVVAYFAVDTYDLTYTAGPGGSITGAAQQTVEYGSDGTEVIAQPDQFYHFVNWSDGFPTANRTDTNVSADISVTANFEIDNYTVASSVGTGSGSITPLGDQQVDHGSTAQFTVTPAIGYYISSMGGSCGGSLDGGTFTTNPITGPCTVVANFAVQTFTLTYNAGAGGSITGSSPQVVPYGGSGSQVTAVADDHYHFVGWSDAVPTASRTDTNVMADLNVTANFAIDTFTVTPSVGSGSGSISPSTPQQVNYGQTRQFTLTPATGYHIVSVGGTCGGSRSGSTYTTAPITANCSVVANFAIDTFTLTYTAGPGGSISGTSPQIVEYGANGSPVTAQPNANYHFVDWSDSVLTATRQDTSITADLSVTANFAPNTHTVTPSVGSGSGSISPSTPQQVIHGQTTAFTLTPLTGYHIASVGGTCGGNLDGSTFTTAAVTTNCSVVANFAIDTFTVTPSVGSGSGTISPSTPQQVNYNQTKQFTLTPLTGYHIASVGGTCGGNLDGSTFTTNAVTANCTVIANFAIDTFTVTPSVGSGSGTISPSTPQQVNYNQTKQFTLTPLTGYHIASVGGTCGGTLVNNTYTTNAVTANCTVIANFAIDTFTLTYTAGSGGSISGISPQTVDYGADGSPVTAVPDENYQFLDWSDGLKTATRQDTNVSANISVTANFAIETFTVTSSVGTGSGSISPLGDRLVGSGQSSRFTLTPAIGSHIASVGGTCGGTLDGNVYDTDPITADCTVIANFAIDTFTLTYTAGAGGTISGTSPQTVDYGEDGSPVTAQPNANYHFVDWSDGEPTATRQDTNVTADLSVTANFAIDTLTVTPSVGSGSGSISPSTPQQVNYNQTRQFTLTPAANYHIAPVGGTCGGTLVNNTYTTNAVTANCTVIANFAIDTFTVTPSVGAGSGSITPSTPQQVDHGQTTQFALTPDTGHHIDPVGGTCDGTLDGDTYTTNPVTADCTVVANFAIDTFTLTYTAGAGGTISGISPQTVEYGADGSAVTAVPDANYRFVNWSDGMLEASRTDTNVTSDISVTANFELEMHTVTSSVGSGAGTISPLGAQEIAYGETADFLLTPAANYRIDSIGGSCGGSLTNNVYTTNPITADCTVVANFAEDQDQIFGDGFE